MKKVASARRGRHKAESRKLFNAGMLAVTKLRKMEPYMLSWQLLCRPQLPLLVHPLPQEHIVMHLPNENGLLFICQGVTPLDWLLYADNALWFCYRINPGLQLCTQQRLPFLRCSSCWCFLCMAKQAVACQACQGRDSASACLQRTKHAGSR